MCMAEGVRGGMSDVVLRLGGLGCWFRVSAVLYIVPIPELRFVC
jgi:hypothetical protein